MIRFIQTILSKLASLVPTTRTIVFCSFPDYSDNAWAFCRYLSNKKIEDQYRFVWLLVDKSQIENVKIALVKDQITAEVIYRRTLKGIWFFIRARYIFTTHGLFDFLHLTQHPDKNINLWHGMPLKKIGVSHDDGKPPASNINYTIATSEIFQKIMAEAFACPIEKVWVTGQPRNDLLFEKTDWFESNGIDRNKFRRIGIWMPTYRQSIVGDVRLDGEYHERWVSFLNEDDLKNLDTYLAEINTLIIVKIHPMDAIQNHEFCEYRNLIFIKPKEFHSQLYPLLGACDFLLTDYSSVFIDYQILHRPIGFVMNDIAQYKNSRGLYFENLEDVLPGPILSTYRAFVDFIKAPCIKESSILFNSLYDAKSSERIAARLGIT